MKNKIGLILFVLYIIQAAIPMHWEYLEELQSDTFYKKWAGFVLLVFILAQWYLSLNRIKNSKNIPRNKFFVELHKWLGVLLPFVFYFHSTQIGYGILLILSITFLLNIGIGLINTDRMILKYPKLFTGWLVSHIFLSVAVLVFTGIHVWVVFFYN